MKLWCIHTRHIESGEVVIVKMPGPDDGERMFRMASRALAQRRPHYVVDMLHEDVLSRDAHQSSPGIVVIMPEFPTAIENMIFQGWKTVEALCFAAHFIINKQKETDS